MKRIFLFLLIPFFLFAYRVDVKNWQRTDTFYDFLKENNIPLYVLYSLPKDIQSDLGSIPIHSDVYILKDGDVVKQALVPFNKQQQLQIIRVKSNDGYKYITKIVPIGFTMDIKKAHIDIKTFLSHDVYEATHNPYLSHKLASIFSDRINFKLLPQHTSIDVYYKTRSRLGKVYNTDILFARIKNRYYDISAYKYTDGRYYDKDGKSLKGMFLAWPMQFKRISSPFGMRFHPILHKMIMHEGIDLVNKIGTPVHSVAEGKVVYKGWMRGYGNTVEVQHRDGYMTLYGHLHGFANIKLGQYVRQGQLIAYMGNTGRSTGPHLHFGVKHNGKWINPKSIKGSVKIELHGKEKKRFLAFTQKINEEMDQKVAKK